MGGIFGVASKSNCVSDLFFGTDYHSHLGTRRGGMAVYGKEGGFNRAIHNIQNAPFRTKFERDVQELEGTLGIGCISDTEPQPLLVQSHLANGCALMGLIDIVNKSGATLEGAGIVIEKGFQEGGKKIREMGVRLESLAIVESMTDDSLTFRPNN